MTSLNHYPSIKSQLFITFMFELGYVTDQILLLLTPVWSVLLWLSLTKIY